MATTQPVRQKSSSLPRLGTMAGHVNWEVALYALIFLAAVASRFYLLGDRVISHDESLHAYFAYKLYQGGGYIHDPRLHGPLQFFLAALSFLLGGADDFTARVPAAVFGVALVMLPLGFRPWLGRAGVLVASLGLLISPGMLFYQRYLRNDAFILFFTALLALCLFRFMRTRRTGWLYLGAAAVALSLASKEVTLIHGFIGALFLAAAFPWERLPAVRFKPAVWLVAGAAALLAGVALLLPPEIVSAKNLWLPAGLLAGVVTMARNVDRRNRPVSGALLWFKNKDALTGPLTLALVILVLLYTAFFTNLPGLNSGTYGAVKYWLAQQGVARGKQPGAYYLMLLLMYEFMPFLIGSVGGLVYLAKKAPDHTISFDAAVAQPKAPPRKARTRPDLYPSDGGTFAAYLIFWAVGALVIYTWAGEKMPWLMVHIALPFIFLTGHVSQTVFTWWASRPPHSGPARRIWPAFFAGLLLALAVLTARFAWLSSLSIMTTLTNTWFTRTARPTSNGFSTRLTSCPAAPWASGKLKLPTGGSPGRWNGICANTPTPFILATNPPPNAWTRR